MAQFRATIQGQRGPASRLGSKSSGIEASINGWDVGIEVYGRHNEQTGRDEFTVYLSRGSNWGSAGECVLTVREGAPGQPPEIVQSGVVALTA